MQYNATQFVQVPLTADTWEAFCKMYDDRGLERPPMPSAAALIAARFAGGDALVGGCCFYSAGPYTFVENLCVGRFVPGALKLEAVRRLAWIARGLATAQGVHLVLAVRGKGLRKILRNAGFADSESVPMHYDARRFVIEFGKATPPAQQRTEGVDTRGKEVAEKRTIKKPRRGRKRRVDE